MRRLFREESAPSGYLGGVFCREQQRSWTPAALELLGVVRCKVQAGAGCSGSFAALVRLVPVFLGDLTITVEQTSITDAEMHAKGYLSDIIPVSTAERDLQYMYFSIFIIFHYLTVDTVTPLRATAGAGIPEPREVFPLETATDEHFQASRERL